MPTFVKSLYLLAVIVWVGTIVFFSFVGAPSIFHTLPPADAGKLVGVIFPAYYILGYVCSGVMLLGGAFFWQTSGGARRWSAVCGLSALMLALTLYAGLVVQPRAAALRPQLHEAATAAAVKPDFDRLHRLAVQLNGAVLLCGLAVTVVTARSLAP